MADSPEEMAPLKLVFALIEKLAEKGVLDEKDAKQIIKRSLKAERKRK